MYTRPVKGPSQRSQSKVPSKVPVKGPSQRSQSKVPSKVPVKGPVKGPVKTSKKAYKNDKIESPFGLVSIASFKQEEVISFNMSSTTNTPVTNAPVIAMKKPRVVKPKLATKFAKFLEFGYVFVQSLHSKGTLSNEGLEAAYSELKLFDDVDTQTGFYEQVLVQSNETGKSMRKFAAQRNQPPKAVKARKPRAKKESAVTNKEEGVQEATEKKEKKARKPRAKKTTNVVQDTANDLVGELVAAANAPVMAEAVQPAAPAVKKPFSLPPKSPLPPKSQLPLKRSRL